MAVVGVCVFACANELARKNKEERDGKLCEAKIKEGEGCVSVLRGVHAFVNGIIEKRNYLRGHDRFPVLGVYVRLNNNNFSKFLFLLFARRSHDRFYSIQTKFCDGVFVLLGGSVLVHSIFD